MRVLDLLMNASIWLAYRLCSMLRIPQELRPQLLRLLVAEGYVTEDGGQIRITEAGVRLVSPARP